MAFATPLIALAVATTDSSETASAMPLEGVPSVPFQMQSKDVGLFNITGFNSCILDSGATHSVWPTRKDFTELHPAHITAVRGIHGKSTPITEAGTVHDMENVLLLPSANRPLLSVSKLLHQYGGSVEFHDSGSVIHKSRSKTLTEIASRNPNGLYQVTRLPLLVASVNQLSTANQLKRERITTSMHGTCREN